MVGLLVVVPVAARGLARAASAPARSSPALWFFYMNTSVPHNHPDEQTMLFHAGRARVFVGENEYVVGPDDILIIPSYVPNFALCRSH